jgi:hypothetical protein
VMRSFALILFLPFFSATSDTSDTDCVTDLAICDEYFTRCKGISDYKCFCPLASTVYSW